jgi:hypothetical protein
MEGEKEDTLALIGQRGNSGSYSSSQITSSGRSGEAQVPWEGMRQVAFHRGK